MDTRLTTTHRAWSLLIAAAMVLALVTTLGASSASAASSTACRVQNTVTSKTYTALQTAVDAATSGDRLVVRGTCRGRTIIDRGLVIEGTRHHAMPRLDGGTTERVLVVRKDATVTMRRLVIQRGQARTGGGILNEGTLTLRDVVVRRNRTTFFGGGVSKGGTLTLRGRTTIRANTVVRAIDPGYTQPSGGGVANAGSLTLDDRSAITGNTVVGRCIQGIGGGLYNFDGPVVLKDHSAISGNRIVLRCARRGGAEYAVGGGVYMHGGTLTLNGSSRISRNRIVARVAPGEVRLFGFGGGVSNRLGGSLTLNDHSAISHNEALMGGGVDARGDFSPLTMTGSSAIVGNIAGKHGGGILHHRRSLLSGVACGPGPTANVRHNRPDDCYVMVWKG